MNCPLIWDCGCIFLPTHIDAGHEVFDVQHACSPVCSTFPPHKWSYACIAFAGKHLTM